MERSRDSQRAGHSSVPALDRRRLLQGASATALGGALATGHSGAEARQATPEPAGAAADDLLRISQGLVGGGALNDGAVPTLAALIGDDPALAELADLTAFTGDTVGATSPAARALATGILRFWYLGEWDGAPVDGRSDLYFSLVAWQTVPYATQPTLCKEFGYWATEVKI